MMSAYLTRALSTMVLVAIFSGTAFSAQAARLKPVTIRNDRGGYVIKYALQMMKLRERKAEVRFVGTCASACTIYLALPGEQTCITERAAFNFHAPYGARGRGNAIAANYMMNAYPGWVRSWIAQNGGLSSRVLVMNFEYASRYMSVCGDSQKAKRAQVAAIAPQKAGPQ